MVKIEGKVIHIVIMSVSWGGAENYLLTLFRFIQKHFDITVHLYGNDECIQFYTPYKNELSSVQFHSLGSYERSNIQFIARIQKFYKYLVFGKRLASFFGKNTTHETINVHLESAVWAYWFARIRNPVLRSMRSVLTAHGGEFWLPVLHPKKYALLGHVVKQFTAYTFFHEYPLECAKKLNVLTDDNYLFIQPATDTDRFKPTEKIPYRIAFVARMNKMKQPLYMIEAMPHILAQIPDVHLDMVGDGKLLAQGKERATELQIEDSVTFHGALDDVLPVIQQSQIFASLQTNANFNSVSSIEAISCGNVIVSTDVGNSEKFVEYGLGVLVPVNDPVVLAKTVVELLQNKEALEKNMQHNRAFALDFYSLEKNLTPYVEFLLR